MKEQKYYEKIEIYIKRNEINKKRRTLEENYDTLTNNWNIGRLLVEAQGGKKRAKYGNNLIKKWSIEYTRNYGKGYDSTNLKRFRQFSLAFQKVPHCGAYLGVILEKFYQLKKKIKETIILIYVWKKT